MLINEYELVLTRKLIDLKFSGKVFIYPFGKLGNCVAAILERKGISYIPLDIKQPDTYRFENIHPKMEDTLLLASNNESIYEEIRENIPAKFPGKIIDLFEEDRKEKLKYKAEKLQMETAAGYIYEMKIMRQKCFCRIMKRILYKNGFSSIAFILMKLI